MKSINLIQFRWRAPKEGFEWRKQRGKADLWLVSTQQRTDAMRPMRPTYPAATNPTLYRDFAGLVHGGQDDVIAFANQHGPLGIPEAVTLVGGGWTVGEPWKAWRAQIVTMDTFVRMADVAARGTLREKNEQISLLGKTTADRTAVAPSGAAVFENLGFDDRIPARAYRDGAKASLHLRKIIAAQVSDQISERVFPRSVVDENKITFRLHPKNLLGYLWASFAIDIDSTSESRTCAMCGTTFLISREHGTRRSRRFCGTNCRSAAYRLRIESAREMATKGQTAAQIANTISLGEGGKVSVKAVQRWIGES